VATGWATDFSTIDIQLHDTYFTIPPVHLFLAVGALGFIFLGADWLSRNNKTLTLMVFLLDGMLFLLFASATVFTWRQSLRISRIYPPYAGDPSMKVLVLSFPAGMMSIAVLLLFLAMRALWRIRRFQQ